MTRSLTIYASLFLCTSVLASPPPAEYPGAIWDPAASCNYTVGRGGYTISYIIIHVMEGGYYGSISWFKDCDAGASAHYMINSEDGEITQMVAESDTAWHAGNWIYNRRSIGIEHEGYIYNPSWFTDTMYKSSAALVSYLCDKYGIPKDRKHIIGHDEVPGCPDGGGGGASCHKDPGPYWDWDYFMSLITGGVVQPKTGNLMGFVREGDIYTGKNIVGALVELSTGQSTKTNSNGLYTFVDLPAGTVKITASATGYKTNSIERTILAGIDNWGSIALQPVAACTSHDHIGCCGDNVCWFDSCGKAEEKVTDCAYGCFGGSCQQCKPSCVLKECGDNGCGGLCGQCFGNEVCIAGKCICVPVCEDVECGDDGCGGLCGTCPQGSSCVNGRCECTPHERKDCCGDAVCWFNSCDAAEELIVQCPYGCSEGKCLNCTPDCDGKICGPDGCGGMCPDLCGEGFVCTDRGCTALETSDLEDFEDSDILETLEPASDGHAPWILPAFETTEPQSGDGRGCDASSTGSLYPVVLIFFAVLCFRRRSYKAP